MNKFGYPKVTFDILSSNNVKNIKGFAQHAL